MIEEIAKEKIDEYLAVPGGFDSLGISRPIMDALTDMGFSEPMPVQKVCIPALLRGEDVIGQARTGTGKTVAFGVPIAQMCTSELYVQAIVLTPTRELCLQVAGEVNRIIEHTGQRVVPVYGGQPIDRQLKALRRGAQIVIGTPGRVIDHIKRRTLELDGVKLAILDEGDEMLDMGFIDDIRYILRQTPPDRQTCMFSATMPDEIRQLAINFMGDSKQYNLSSDSLTVAETAQIFYEVPEDGKFEALCNIIDYEEINLGLIFCRTRWETQQLGMRLKGRGYDVLILHGDMTQAERERSMKSFRDGRIEILVATDVAARGIDVSDVTHVINYHLPQNPEGYVHRIGRTGRAGKTGTAVTLVTPKEYYDLYRVQARAGVDIEIRPLPAADDVEGARRTKWARTILSDARPDKIEPFKALVKEIAAETDAETLAAVALAIAWDKTFRAKAHRTHPVDERDFKGPRKGRGGGRPSDRKGGRGRDKGPRGKDRGRGRGGRDRDEPKAEAPKKAKPKKREYGDTKTPIKRRLSR